MKTRIISRPKAFTLIEVTVIISILIILAGMSLFGVHYYRNWQKALAAGEEVKKVLTAQQLYLADHPTKAVTDLTDDDIIKNLPNGGSALPTAKGLDGEVLTIDYKVSPPVLMNGGAVYDPSGNPEDNQWDAGK